MTKHVSQKHQHTFAHQHKRGPITGRTMFPLLVLILSILVWPALPVRAETVKIDPERLATEGRIDTIIAALTLGDYGIVHGDPLIVAGAAAVLSMHNHKAAVVSELRSGPAPVKPNGSAIGRPSLLPENSLNLAAPYLLEARRLARGDRTILTAIDRIEGITPPPQKKALRSHLLALDPNTFTDLQFMLVGSEHSSVVVIANADIDLLVTDIQGSEICREVSPEPREICRWTPQRGGAFTIRITSYSKTAARALLIFD